TIYVNQKPLKTLDLTTFADGAYAGFSNAAVTVGAWGARQWLDNFQVGAPYVGYQALLGSVAGTGYDFGVKEARAEPGAIQGAVVLAPNTTADPFAPGLPPFSSIRVFVDLDGNGRFDPGEPFDITDAHGIYRIANLRPGSYVVKQELSLAYS